MKTQNSFSKKIFIALAVMLLIVTLMVACDNTGAPEGTTAASTPSEEITTPVATTPSETTGVETTPSGTTGVTETTFPETTSEGTTSPETTSEGTTSPETTSAETTPAVTTPAETTGDQTTPEETVSPNPVETSTPPSVVNSTKNYAVSDDQNPFLSFGVTNDSSFALDKNLNSVVCDMGKTTKINRVVLKSTCDDIGLINKNHISVFTSNDNKNFTCLKNFSMLQTGNELYIYNFEVEARYIKVHSTLDQGTEGRITNTLQKLAVAQYNTNPLLSEGNFAYQASATVTNDTAEIVYDKIVSFTLSELGISESHLKADKSDIRFICDGKYLPHYYANGKFTVRVLEIAANSTASIKILYGNEKAESVSDGNETFEVQYGTKRSWAYEGGWITTVITAPNGDLLKFASFTASGGFLGVFRSTDGGLTWLDRVNISATTGSTDQSGAIVDKEAGKIFLFSMGESPYNSSKQELRIFLSEDNGYTWKYHTAPTGTYAKICSYADGIKLSTADGTGPNVDYVYTGSSGDGNGNISGVTSVYSKDGGNTWISSQSLINYDFGGKLWFEDGMSEDALFEADNGDLILYTRCQFSTIDPHFAISISKDKGVTWSRPQEDDLSNIYASNTQPIIEKLGELPVLMWAGNNSVGARSYTRHPLNLAYTLDNGETFTGIIDVSLQTVVNTRAENHKFTYNTKLPTKGFRSHLITNPDMTFATYKDIDMLFIQAMWDNVQIMNVEDYLLKTKGAYDSFEDGHTVEGWFVEHEQATNNTVVERPTPTLTDIGATDGEKAMLLAGNSVVSRTVHYIEEGSVSFDLNLIKRGAGFDIELQSAYNYNKAGTAPIRLYVDASGNLYYYTTQNGSAKTATGITLDLGQHSFEINFDGNAKTASITVDGVTKNITYIDGMTVPAISYVTIFTNVNNSISIDRFIAIKEK